MLDIFQATIRHTKDPTGDTGDLVVSPTAQLELFQEVDLSDLGLDSKWYISSLKNEYVRLRVGLMSKTAVLSRSMIIKDYSKYTIDEMLDEFAQLTGLNFRDDGDFGSQTVDATSWIGTTLQDALKDLADQLGAYLIVGAQEVILSDSPTEATGNSVDPVNVLGVSQNADAMGVATKVVATWIEDDGTTVEIDGDVQGDFALTLYYYLDTSNMDSEARAREAVAQKVKAFEDQLNAKTVRMAGIIDIKVGDTLNGYGVVQEVDYEVGSKIETKVVVA